MNWNSEKNPIDVALRLSLQRALLCEISSNLRLVAFEHDDKKKKIVIYFYFDNEITDENRDSASSIAGEVAGDFDEETQVLEECIHLDFPKKPPAHQDAVYRRKE